MNGEDDGKTTANVSASKVAMALFSKLPISIKMALVGIAAGVIVLFLIISVIATIISSVEGLLIPDTSKLEEKISDAQLELRERVDRVAAQIKSETRVDIDRPLLVSTLVYDGDLDTISDEDLMENIEGTINGESGQSWLGTLVQGIGDKIANISDTYLGTAFTKKGKELRRWRKSELTIYSVAFQMVNGNKLDLEFYKQNLIKNIIPSYYHDQISESNKLASIKEIANEIFDLAELFRFWFEEDEKKSTCTVGGACTYDIMGETVGNIEVELINCDGSESNYKVLKTVPLEDYVLGVVNAEVGSDSDPEVMKAQAIIARTFALVRQYQMCPGRPENCFYGYNPTTKKVRIRACEADQVYCDPKEDCYRKPEGRISKYSPEVGPGTEGAALWAGKRAMTDEEYTNYVRKLDPAKGKVALDAQGNIANVNFFSTQQKEYARLAEQGYDYTQIILKVHAGGENSGLANAISESRCASSGSKNCGNQSTTGDFKKWKQLTGLGASWGTIPMGDSNINNIGCLATSIAIQAANSGAATGSDFNPGTFVQSCVAAGVINSEGNMDQSRVSEIIPGFNHVYSKDIFGTSKTEKIEIVKAMLQDSCYPVMEVKGAGNCSGCGQHWVAVDYASDSEIYMMDPASEDTGVFARYGNKGASISCYKKS